MKNLEFDIAAFEDLAWWVERDRKQALKIIKLIQEVQRNPFQGIGKPEKLKHDLSGCWSIAILNRLSKKTIFMNFWKFKYLTISKKLKQPFD